VQTEDDFSELRRAEATGRPLGAPEFVTGLERLLGRKIARRAPGRRPATEVEGGEQLKLLRIGIMSPDFPVSVTIADTQSSLFSTPSFSANAGNMTGGSAAESGFGTIYSYTVPAGGYAPNGNILTHVDSVMGTWNFSYDAVDRLLSAQNNGATSIALQYAGKIGCWTYDSFGNRTMEAVSATGCTSSPSPQMWAHYNQANNRITSTTNSPAEYSFGYDYSGNTQNDGINKYWYDAEGQLCAVQNIASSAITAYVYDAEGARIAKGSLSTAPGSNQLCAPLSPSGGNLTSSSGFSLSARWLVDLGGQQVTELDGSNNWKHSNVFSGGRLTATYDTVGLHYALADPLGTKRVQANVLGQVDENCTSLPFGNDLGTNPGVNCWAPQNGLQTNDDATEHHFTGKERDTESGNDYFEARYYASSMGRFMSPDWSAKYEPIPYAKLDNPQSLNLYSYVLNNPLSAVDPDGHETAEEVAKKNVDNAKISAGTDRYDKSATVVSNGQVFTSGKDKCNLYVSETMKNSTGEHTTVDGTGKIPSAAAFADPNVKITGLSAPEPMANAKPGDVIAQDHGANPTSGNEEGHVGIVVSLPHDGQPGQTASANANEGGKVTINDWGFRSPTANPNNGERSGASSPAPVVRHPLGDQQ